MVHRYAPMDTVRRTVSRATRPALIPLRAAASTLPEALRPVDGDVADDAGVDEVDADPPATADAGLDELEQLRGQLAAAPDLHNTASAERAQRATRSASAYLEARRARLKRELREMSDRT